MNEEIKQNESQWPLVSIVIPAFNNAEYIEQTVQSALDQTYLNIEVIVVDDGSTDNTLEILKVFEDKIRIIAQDNGGPASARNAGIKESRGEYIAFLDGDDLFFDNKIEIQMNIFESYGQIALIYSNIQKIDEEDVPLKTEYKRRRPTGDIFKRLFRKNRIPLSTVIVKKSALDEVGLFDEDPELISVEDYDLWLRFAARFPAYYTSRTLVKYRIHSQGISRNINRSFLGEQKVILNNWDAYKSQYPYDAGLLNERLARLYFEFGFEHFYVENYIEARARFLDSLCFKKYQPKCCLYLLLTYFNGAQIKVLKGLKRKMTRMVN